ncbi:DUF4352 domain-containing protein [Mesobacillus foraminis]|uniref:DUF4352 domain-containing protein n=1 Tax=Mesobacillus foraminis TaxID=279826 RepID=UPI001BE6D9C6|nr:DUF4352 domain-containing protein [Mesobacillus foraminis]MBT2756722.1 DUF4352 domain-containing protein [Mesobacillus foraminis]
MDGFALIIFFVAGFACVVLAVLGISSFLKRNGQARRKFKQSGISILVAFAAFIVFALTADTEAETAGTSTEKPVQEEKAASESAEEKEAKEKAEAQAKEEEEAKAKAEAEKEAKAEAAAKKKAEEEAKKKAEAAAKKKAEEEAKKPKIGDVVKAGDFEYVITAANEKQEIPGDGVFIESKTTSGKFVVIDYTVKNNDKEARMVDSNLFLLKSGKNEYDPMVDADIMMLLGDKNLFLEEVNPGLNRSGQLVFEVGADVKNYSLEVSSGLGWSGGEYSTIKLK